MMVHQRKSARYTVSGVQSTAGHRMNVRSNVTLPDAEAGTDWAEDREPFRASGVAEIVRKRSYEVPVHIAALILCALFVAFGSAVIGKMVQKSKITRDIWVLRESISLTMEENQHLAVEVAGARDSARVDYLAVRGLRMVTSDSVEVVPVIAPDTRPNLTAQTTQTGVWDGTISGSR